MSSSSYKAFSIQEVAELMLKQIDDVVAVTNLPKATARILLHHANWDKQELLDRFINGKLQNIFDTDSADLVAPSAEWSECSICFDDFPLNEKFVLGCGHEFCKFCCCEYLTMKFINGQSASICCPARNCTAIFNDSSIIQLVLDESVSHKYLRLVTHRFVELDDLFRWCPSPDCTLAIRAISLGDRLSCTCSCGYTFCFGCGDESHDPIPCTFLKAWKNSDNDSTADYLYMNTKGCPDCDSLMEHTGFCDQMICTNCTYEFCWNCLGNWKLHRMIDCDQVQRKTKDETKRWFHYLFRFGHQKLSLAYEQWLANDIVTGNKFKNVPCSMFSWDKQQYVEAEGILRWCRKQILLLCIFAHSTKDEEYNQKLIFEDRLLRLEEATDELYMCLTNSIVMQNIMNQARLCKTMANGMTDFIYEVLDKHCHLATLFN